MGDGSTWVIGSGGLVGSAIVRSVTSAGGTVWQAAPVAWAEPGAAESLGRNAQSFLSQADGAARIVWSAGFAVTSSSAEEVRVELDTLRSFVEALASHRPVPVLYVSSAGGAYAAATGGLIDENSPVAPSSAYGRGKVEGEQLVSSLAANGNPVAVVRPTNVYGPGQNPAKSQGLVSTLIRAALSGDEVTITAPLETTRDYVFSEDLGTAVSEFVRRVPSGQVQTRIVAAGEGRTISEVIAAVESESGRRIRVRVTDSSSGPVGPRIDYSPGTWDWLGLPRPLTLEEGIRRLLTVS